MSTQVQTATGNKIDQKAPLGSGTNVQSLLESYRQAFEIAAPKHLDVNRVMRIALMEVSRNRSLLECTAGSLLASFMTAVQLGLEIGIQGQAYLVPFRNKKTGKKEVQLIPGYRGLVQLARNSGQISTVYANVVYKQDRFKYLDGLDRILEHEPMDGHNEDPADIVAAYAIARFKDGGFQLDVMRRQSIDKIRARSQAKDSGPWVTDYAEMAKKTVIRRLSKLLPVSIEMAIAVTLDDRGSRGVPQQITLTEGDMPVIEVGAESGDEDQGQTDGQQAARGQGVVDIDSIRQGSENRGHGNENLAGVTSSSQPAGSGGSGNVPASGLSTGTQAPAQDSTAADPPSNDNGKVTDDQWKDIQTLQMDNKVDHNTLNTFIRDTLKYKTVSALKQKDLKRVVAFITAGGKEQQQEGQQ